MKLLKQYFELQQKIYDYFGYQEDWKVIPLDDQIDKYWMYIESSQKIVYSDKPFTEQSIKDGQNIYSGILYTQRFLPKWNYKTEKYTMISVDTLCDGNKFLMIFDNSKEEKNQSIKDLYLKYW